jgi:hypothetical protein
MELVAPSEEEANLGSKDTPATTKVIAPEKAHVRTSKVSKPLLACCFVFNAFIFAAFIIAHFVFDSRLSGAVNSIEEVFNIDIFFAILIL